MNIYAVIMAGGIGSRFWPRSKRERPKQLLKIFGETTLIQETINRLDGFLPLENIYIITTSEQKILLTQQLIRFPEENIIEEPFGKNTAACIGLASLLIRKKSKDAVTVVFPSDHLITDISKFHSVLNAAIEYAYSLKGLVTIGIKPSSPNTGYGYIQIDETQVMNGISKALTFAEKPNLSTAQRLANAGDFLWNSGIFVWHVDVILSELKQYMPDLHAGLEEIDNAIGMENYEAVKKSVYGKIKNISIDYGLMEKSKKVYIIKGDFGWSDIGNWDAVYDYSDKDHEGNAVTGEVYTEETFDSYIYSPKKFTAVIGVENLIVINTNDALLICDRKSAQEVKHVIEYLKMKNRTDLL